MFGGQTGVLFGSTPTQNNTFGQAPNNATSFFSSNIQSTGSTIPYQSVDSTDNIQKNNQSVNINTKLHCLTAMKPYESKSIEELRSEDYQANRLTKSTNTIFTGQQNAGMVNSQPMFSSFSPNQQSQSSLFGNTNQPTSSFGNKSLFGGTTTSTNSSFGAFNSTKPTLFSSASSVNKPLFAGTQSPQSSSIFGSPTVSNTSNLFGAQQQPAQTSLFFNTSQQSQVQPNQPSSIFGNVNSTFGFQPATNTSLFGNTNKAFGNVGGFPTTSSTASVFGNATQSTGSLFGQQNTTTTAFGGVTKTPMFSSTFQAQPASNQGAGLFGQTATAPLGQQGLFGNTKATTFATPSMFANNTSKSSLFSNPATNTFASQPSTGFGVFGTATQQFNPQTVTTSTVVPTIGYSSPQEALLQQQMSQQKILSLVSNRPYGVNKLFLGQNLLSTDKIVTSSDSITNNTNIMSLAIKRNDTDKYGMVSRRKIIDQKTKIVPSNLYKVFSGFDDDDDTSVKSGNLEKHFLTKRDDWKYLPPDAFEKSRSSINSNNAAINSNTFINHSSKSINNNISINGSNSLLLSEAGLTQNFSSPISNVDRLRDFNKKTFHSTPIPDNSKNDQSFTVPFSPIRINETKLDESDREYVLERNLGASSFEHNITSGNDSLKVKLPTNATSKQEEVLEENDEKQCRINLTKDGYYTAPDSKAMDTLVTKNEDGEWECFVENFIIGRRSFGSIRFPGITNVYGLNFDELVDIQRHEVSVYPDEDKKPEEGEELNKRAQIILHEVWPTDKSTGQPITDEERLKAMNFENNLRKRADKMGTRFISYSALKGVWIFEVDHFSKYRYDDSDESDQEENKAATVTDNKEGQSSDIGRTNDNKVLLVVSAEADSMSEYPCGEEIIAPRRGIQRLFDHNSNRSIQQMKQNLYQDDNNEDDVDSTRLFTTNNRSFAGNFRQKEEPEAKRFETLEMGRSMLNTSLNNSTVEYNRKYIGARDVDMCDNDFEESRPIKPLSEEPLASTKSIPRSDQGSQRLKIANQFRDIRSMKMPYLPLKIKQYFDIELTSMSKKRPFDSGIIQGNRFRVGFHMSNDESPGLKFIRKDNCNQPDISMTPIGVIRHERLRSNVISVMTLDSEFSDYQERLLKSALDSSYCNFNNDDDQCPLWLPVANEQVLNSYLSVQNEYKDSPSDGEVHIFGRIVTLCRALWASIGDNDESVSTTFMKQLERKQALSKWIRAESREELMKKVDWVMRSSVTVDVDKCNDIILESLCCGEISLACTLATKTKQHRMALLMSQCAGSLHNRANIREQLNLWIADKTDENIPANIMCIYTLLSGLTNVTVSDGSIITPMKQLKWYQAFGCYQWFIQPYLDSIKSSLDLYEEDFKTDLDIPAPFPISLSVTTDDDFYPYHDCCYHLLKLSCDSLYDMDVLLNPPTITRSNNHKLSIDWSPSWHLANILASLGRSIQSMDKINNEWASQLERDGQWHWAVFALLHCTNSRDRKNAVRNILTRHATATRGLSDREVFVVEKLQVPAKWVYAAKAIRCKNDANDELEAYHWLMAGDYEKSHRIYVDGIWPRLLINDRFDKMSDLLGQFTGSSGFYKHMLGWPHGGGVYQQYCVVMHLVRTLRKANKLMKYSVLGEEEEIQEEIVANIVEDGDFEEQLEALKTMAKKLSVAIEGYVTNNNEKIICKRQMDTLCRSLLDSCTDI